MQHSKFNSAIGLFSRRRFLTGFSALALTLPFSAKVFSVQTKQQEWWVSAQGRDKDNYGLAMQGARTSSLKKVHSRFRGHGVVQHPIRPNKVLMLARRPGRYGIEVDIPTAAVKKRFTCAPHRFLQGHGCFSKDGSVLYTSESDLHSGKGLIVLRDSLSYEVLDEFDSHGIGPHELKLMPDGQTLVVANGGLHTHPDSGRRVLNLATMHSTLTYLDARTGALLEQQQVAEAKASIRHLDVAHDGTVVIAMQLQRAAMNHSNIVALSAVHRRGAAIKTLTKPDTVIAAMNDYIGSTAINNQYRVAGFASPRGNLVAFWHIDTLRFLGYHAFHDVCGLTVSADAAHFVLSNSRGEIRQLRAEDLQEERYLRQQVPGLSWDNHLISIALPETGL